MFPSNTFSGSLVKGLIAGLIAALFNAILFYVFSSIGAINDTIHIQPGTPLAIQNILISSVIPSLIAGIVYFLISLKANNPLKTFQRLALTLLILSFISPFLFIPHVTFSYASVLNGMHIVVAWSIMYVFRKFA